jgi:hypothetical protein
MIAPFWSRLKSGMASHPSERDLHRFADDGMPVEQRQRTAAHLLACARCRTVVTDVRAIGDAARAHDTEAPDLAALREQILARRAAGARVILPVPRNTSYGPAEPLAAVSDTRVRAAGAWRGLAAAAFVGAVAGATAVGGLWQAYRHVESVDPRVTPVAMGATLDLMGGATCSLADPEPGDANPGVAEREGSALRQLLADDGLAALVPLVGCHTQEAVAPPIRDFDASRVRPMTIAYHARTFVDTIAIESDDRSLAIARAMVNGQPAWNITGHSNRHPLVTKETDSLYLSAADLRPLRQVSFGSHGARRLGIDLKGDAGTLHLDGYRERPGADTTTLDRPVALVHQPGATFGPAPLETIVLGLNLRDGWSGSVNVLAPQCLICSMRSVGWPGQSFTNAPLIESLRVDGSDHVVVPGGAFDCWRIRVTGGIADGSNDRGVHTIWVAKSSNVIVKDVIVWTDADGVHYQRTHELTSLIGT